MPRQDFKFDLNSAFLIYQRRKNVDKYIFRCDHDKDLEEILFAILNLINLGENERKTLPVAGFAFYRLYGYDELHDGLYVRK